MRKLFESPLFHLALVLFLTLGFEGYSLVSAQYASPASRPPNDVSYPPLDTGSVSQVKSGSLYVGDANENAGLLSSGALGFTKSGVLQSSIRYDANAQEPVVYNRVEEFGNTVNVVTSTLNSGWEYSNGVLYHNGAVGIGNNANQSADLSIGNTNSAYPIDFLSISTSTIPLQDPYYAFFLGVNAAFSKYQASNYSVPIMLSRGSGGSPGFFYTNNPTSDKLTCISVALGQGGQCNLGIAGFVTGGGNFTPRSGRGIWFDNRDESVYISGTLTSGKIAAISKDSLPDLPSGATTAIGGKYTWGGSYETCPLGSAQAKANDAPCILQFPGSGYPSSRGGKCPDGYFITGARFSSEGGLVLECHTMFPNKP